MAAVERRVLGRAGTMPSVGPVVPMQYMLQSQLPTYTEPSLPMTGEAVTKSWVAIVQRVYTAGVWAREVVGRRRCSR